jgi:hypothetical protein
LVVAQELVAEEDLAVVLDAAADSRIDDAVESHGELVEHRRALTRVLVDQAGDVAILGQHRLHGNLRGGGG